MSDEIKKPELYVVGKEENDGITDITEDSLEEKLDNSKRHFSKAVRRINSTRNTEKKAPSIISLVVIIALILSVVYIISDFSTGGVLYTANGKVISAVYGGAADKFSVNTGGDIVYDFIPYGNAYAILTENGIAYINSSGSVAASQQITYSSPAVAFTENRLLIYDRGNNSYSLQQNESMYSQQKTEGKIIDSAISRRNNYAIAVRDEKSRSILYGMDETGKIIYQWNCPEGYISDVVLDSTGGKACVAVINSRNAVLYSTVYILDFEYDSEYAIFEFNDATVIGLKFLSSRNIQVVTDKNVHLIKNKELQTVYEYGSADVYFTDFSDKYTAVVTKDYSHDDTYNLSVFGKSGKLRYTVPLSGKIRDMSVSEKSVAILYSDKAETYSKAGKLSGLVTDINHYDEVILNGNYLYVLSSDSVKKIPAYGSTSLAVNADAEDETLI